MALMDRKTPVFNPAYLNVFLELSDKKRYTTWNIDEFYVERKGVGCNKRVNVIVRVDVDNALHLEPYLANLLEKHEIHATHFFLTHPDRYYRIWGSGIPRKVMEYQGQEVGLHTDHYYEELTFHKSAIASIKSDVKRLSTELGTPIKGMSYHGHQKINALKVKNRDVYMNIPPENLGLVYHDGNIGPYRSAMAAGKWRPKCDIQLSDFPGFPNSWGWSYLPKQPINILRSMKLGKVVHLTIHTKNAFQYWINWDTTLGEDPQQKEHYLSFLRKKVGLHIKVAKPFIVNYSIHGLSISITMLSWILARVIGLTAKKWRSPDPYRNWSFHNESFWKMGVNKWEERLLHADIHWYNKDVLEIGSGPGHWIAALSKHGKRVVGIEPSPAMTAKAVQEFKNNNIDNVQIVRAYAEFLPIADASHDIVLCLGVLQFTKREKCLSEIFRVLRPGGKAYISTNGFGYYIMRLKMGIGNRDAKRTEQGLIGILAGIVQLWFKNIKLGQMPTTVKRFVRTANDAGFVVSKVRLWLPRDLYPLEHGGFPTSYLFVLEKPSSKEYTCIME